MHWEKCLLWETGLNSKVIGRKLLKLNWVSLSGSVRVGVCLSGKKDEERQEKEEKGC